MVVSQKFFSKSNQVQSTQNTQNQSRARHETTRNRHKYNQQRLKFNTNQTFSQQASQNQDQSYLLHCRVFACVIVVVARVTHQTENETVFVFVLCSLVFAFVFVVLVLALVFRVLWQTTVFVFLSIHRVIFRCLSSCFWLTSHDFDVSTHSTQQ